MAQDDPIIQMVGDPDFPKLSLPEQQKALTAHDPMFGNMDPMNITAFVQAHQAARPNVQSMAPGTMQKYKGGPLTQAPTTERAMQQTMGGPPMFTDVPAGEKQQFEQAGLQGYAQGGKAGAEIVGGAAGPGAAESVPGVLGAAMRMVGAGGGATLANIGANLMTGKKPTVREAAQTGMGYAAGEGIGEAANLLPRTGRASAAINEIRDTLGTHTIDPSEAGNIALRAKDLSQTGARMPKVLNDFLRRATDPEKGAITLAEGRDFYVNATKLASGEFQQITGPMKAQVAEFTQKLGSALNDAVARAGRGNALQDAINEYRGAKQMQSWAKWVVGTGGGLTAGEMAKQGLMKMLGKK